MLLLALLPKTMDEELDMGNRYRATGGGLMIDLGENNIPGVEALNYEKLENRAAEARREKREIHSIHEEDQSIDEQSSQARMHGWTFLSSLPWRYVSHENIDASFSFF